MFTPEFELLLCCTKPKLDAGPIRDVVTRGLNWQKVLKLAEQHGVRPTLRYGLNLACWDFVPEWMQLELERFHRTNLQKNLVYTVELGMLLSLFQKNGIAVAAFKGPILAESLYGHLSLREFIDLDIMVHPADLCKAEDILIARGYQAQFPDRDFRSTFVSYQGQYAFCHDQTGISVDLHWQLSNKGVAFPVQSADVWSRLRQVTIADRTIPTLADDDLVLFLAAHGTKEGWRRLIWVSDFAQLMSKCKSIDYAEVFDRANRAHSSRSLLLAINLATTLLDAPAPASLIDRARANSAVRSLSEKARLRMITTTSQGELSEFLNALNTHDLLRHRLWPIATLLTTRTVGDYEAMSLPKLLWGVYYFTRPFRLAIKAMIMLFSNKSV